MRGAKPFLGVDHLSAVFLFFFALLNVDQNLTGLFFNGVVPSDTSEPRPGPVEECTPGAYNAQVQVSRQARARGSGLQGPDPDWQDRASGVRVRARHLRHPRG